VAELIAEVQPPLTDAWMITARKEWSNCVATASIVIGDFTLIADVPVGYLLYLEKQLTDLRTFIGSFPTLDISEDWVHDDNSGWYKTAPVATHRTKKVQRPLVLYQATPEHPAQTQLITEDVIAGYWSTIKYSGALPTPMKANLAHRVETLLRAVKEAREAANSREEVVPPALSSRLLGYLFSSS
jgi:hypothetical protein